MGKRSSNYHSELIGRLKDPHFAQEYLNAALRDEETGVFLVALKNVVEAQYGGMSALATETHLNRENLYRMLSEQGNPRLHSLSSILEALGFHLKIASDDEQIAI